MIEPGPLPVGPEVIRPEGPSMVVGRAESADVRLCHPAVSRRHALLQATGGRLRVQTLGGRSGLRVNGRLVLEHVLEDGDRVDFGPVA